MLIAALWLSLMGPEIDVSSHDFNRKACEAFPAHDCAGWRYWAVARCDESGETTCVTMTHPTAWEHTPNEFRAVFSRHGLQSMHLRTAKGYKKVYENPIVNP